MMQAGGQSGTSGFREQMAGQLRAARVLTDLIERGAREGLPRRPARRRAGTRQLTASGNNVGKTISPN
jgi:hypothetical protein